MRKFEIIEVDRDYRKVTGAEVKEFPSKADADAYCRKESWTGYTYYAREVHG
jgi:hypothetical protein